MHGLSARCAVIRTHDSAFASIAAARDGKEGLLIELARRTVVEDAADVVIFAGGPRTGQARRVAVRIPVPIVSSIKQRPP
jgi:Asp/Glu/hydantoin racemase